MTVAVSVVVPAYNDAAHLGDALRRLLQQTGVDFEVVVVDDGSTDESAAVAEFAAAADPRIRVFRQPQNAGVALARQRGVRESRGEWVWFVDSDDDWPDSAAAVLHAAGTSADADVVVAAARFEFGSGRAGKALTPPDTDQVESGERALTRMLRGSITGHLWNKLFRRSLLERIEYVPARVQSDLPMVASALALADHVVYIPNCIYSYRVRPGSIITTVSRRAESLELVDHAVQRAVAHHPAVQSSLDYRYFVARYIVLSGMKDAVLGNYPEAEQKMRCAAARARIRPQLLLVLLRRNDWRRLALAVTASTSLPAYRRLLAVADR